MKTLRLLQAVEQRRGGLVLDWTQRRDNDLACRFDEAKDGQLTYFANQSAHARRRRRRATRAFVACTALALAATFAKLLLKVLGDSLAQSPLLPGALGLVAVWMPVLAVGAMSWSSALDLRAREVTFTDMGHFLSRQRKRLLVAANEAEFLALTLDTEVRLLGETLTWYSRRAFFSVA